MFTRSGDISGIPQAFKVITFLDHLLWAHISVLTNWQRGVNGKDSVPFFHWEKQNSYIFFLNDHIGLAFCKPFRVVFDTFFNDNSRLQLLLQYLTKINATFFSSNGNQSSLSNNKFCQRDVLDDRLWTPTITLVSLTLPKTKRFGIIFPSVFFSNL